MRDLQVRDVLDLAAANVADAEDHIQRMYSWHYEHRMTAAKLIFGAAGSLLAAILLAFFKEELKIPRWQVVLVISGAIATGVYGALLFRRVRRIHREYVSALQLHADLKRLGPFLRLYRNLPRV